MYTLLLLSCGNLPKTMLDGHYRLSTVESTSVSKAITPNGVKLETRCKVVVPVLNVHLRIWFTRDRRLALSDDQIYSELGHIGGDLSQFLLKGEYICDPRFVVDAHVKRGIITSDDLPICLTQDDGQLCRKPSGSFPIINHSGLVLGFLPLSSDLHKASKPTGGLVVTAAGRQYAFVWDKDEWRTYKQDALACVWIDLDQGVHKTKLKAPLDFGTTAVQHLVTEGLKVLYPYTHY